MASVRKMGLGVLWILPLLLLPIGFFAALPWLKTINQTIAISISAVLTILAMSYANYLGFRALNRLDEVQKAGAAFAAQWGAPAGQAVFALLLMLPSFQSFATATVSAVTGTFAPEATGITVVVLCSLAVGFAILLILQSIGTVVVQAMWWAFKR